MRCYVLIVLCFVNCRTFRHLKVPLKCPPGVCFVCCAMLIFAYRRLHHEFLMVRGDGSWEGAEFIIETR